MRRHSPRVAGRVGATAVATNKARVWCRNNPGWRRRGDNPLVGVILARDARANSPQRPVMERLLPRIWGAPIQPSLPRIKPLAELDKASGTVMEDALRHLLPPSERLGQPLECLGVLGGTPPL